MEIEKKIIEIQNEVRALKASQTIGQSNSMNYKIVENAVMTITTSQYSYGEKKLVFTSSGRAFPHFCIVVTRVEVVGGGSATITPYYPAAYSWEYSPDLYSDAMMVEARSSSANKTVNIYFTMYSDTPGIYKEA